MRDAKEGNRIRRLRMNCERALAISGALFLFPVGLLAAQPSFDSYQTHSHFVIPVDPNVSYSVTPIEDGKKTIGLRLVLSGLKTEIASLGGKRDLRTRSITAKRLTENSEPKVIYEFLFSAQATKLGVEHFDYRNKVPSEIALDYWLKSQKIDPKPTPTKA
ncbi:MAG: hypothetical protein AB1540_15670, partial [Bdellovibrionota bacterium]